MFIQRSSLLLILSLSALVAQAQVGPEPKILISGQTIDRAITGGESHSYQFSLAAGQFVRLVVEQKAIDVELLLTAPDGKQVAVVNLTGVGGLESLSMEASAGGEYQLTVRAIGPAILAGSYKVGLEVKATATARDRQRIAAEHLLLEAFALRKQGAKTAEQAIDKLQQALLVWRELDDPYWAAWSLATIGAAHYSLNRYDKAIEYFEQALLIYREVKNRAGEGNTISSLGNSYFASNRYEKAIEYYEQALVIFRDLKDRSTEGRNLNNLANANIYLNRYDKAIEYLEQALAIYRGVKDRSGEGIAIVSLGNVYYIVSRYEKAIEYYEQSVAISREAKNRSSEGTALNNLGLSYTNLNRHEKAIEYFEQALSMAREDNDLGGEGEILNNLGIAYGSLDRFERAIEYLEQALAIERKVKNRWGEGNTLNFLGSDYYTVGGYEKSIEYLEQALVIHREVQNRFGEGIALNTLGQAYSKTSRNERAIGYYEQALAINREVKNRLSEADTLYNWALAERAQGNFSAARTRVEESLRVNESTRSEVISPESRASFLTAVQSSYQLYTDVLMRQHQAEPTKGFDALAVEVSERQRARSLLDLLAEAGADLRQGVDAALIESESSLGKQLNDKAQLLMQADKPEQVDALKKEISQLENDYERAQAAIRKASPHYAALVQPQPLKLKEIQAQLDADTLLLEYALGEDRSYLWAITRDSLTSYELPKEELIQRSAMQVYEMLTARNTNKSGETDLQRKARITDAEAKVPAASQALSQMLLGPAAAQLGDKRLVIVADGALQYIPFAMLPDPVVGGRSSAIAKNIGQPLIVGHEVVSLPSASALAIQRTELAGRQPAPKMLAVIADPVFDRTDVRFKSTPSAPDEKALAKTEMPADTRGLEHIADPSATEKGRLVIRRLPFTRQEADGILALAPTNSSLRETDFQASRSNVLSGNLAQYRYVHFATHGLMDSERPGLSALVLSTVDAEGKPQNGFLRANDIYNMKLPAELVVLSACQTGLGKEVKGEGLIGLTRGFMYAGAKRVVVSLWSVNDKATSDLMTNFYRGMLKNNERPAAALRAAQIEMWKQKKWQSPYYWAAFTMQGEWR